VNREILIACAVFVGVACAGAVPPAADTAIDWTAVAEEGVPTIVTQDPDGSERVTKLWLVVLDGEGLIRTDDTRWFRNIQRDPNVVFRVGGYAHPLRAELVTDDSLEERANAAFREKYGLQDWMIHPFGEPDKNVIRLVPREQEPTHTARGSANP
jgi:hypothetical protein